MDAKVCAAATGLATATTPTGAATIAARKTSGRPGRAASLRHALIAIVCVLGAASAVLVEDPADADGSPDTVRIVATASPADSAVSSHDSAVRQVVLGIISFTRWPTTPVRLHLCVTGRPDYARGLTDTLQAGSTLLDVQRVRFDDPSLGMACDVVYLGTLSDDERTRVRAAVAGHPVLTISEHDSSCTAGGMFCLNVDGERVTFDINLDAVARSGVRVHPNVLNLARRPGAP
ncbi:MULTISPECIES: YfiR family protein [Burkholderia]|uniref:YfiR family protein n=1 Tax=Burkholderia TaxID=32008 RepID=UPI00158E55F1|nr:YfiR family protein [Burkholderia cepacia]MCA8054011.1 YfiR family protein [Burkholderia cepacia]MCA8131684.1 YfiR family protein [Burkholderia cepacia]MCA8159765.1 YfiR family protein [Burkholderia cepacia]MDN7614222.1 YfiR family protein [Burkholderia cepacia]MDN7635009.1 YfiR family protein [Burkholderia cepacia]